MSITPDSTVAAAPHLSIADLGDEAVLLDPESGNYFGLNEVASRILTIAREGATIGSITDRLLEEYDVPREVLERDVLAFARDLEQHGLLRVT